jgi:hypothetical protein
LLAFIALVIKTLRVGTGAANFPPVVLLYRAYGA